MAITCICASTRSDVRPIRTSAAPSAAALALLLSGAAFASSSGAGSDHSHSSFAVAHGEAAYAIMPDAFGVNGQIVIRRLGFDGGVRWEDRWGRGRRETPVQAAVHHNLQLVLLGDSLDGCFAARWHAEGRQSWSTTLALGDECRARALHVDAAGQVYALGTVSGGGIVQAALWKLDSRGDTLWRYRHDGPTPHYAYGLSLSPTGDEITVTVARNGPSGWVYDNVRLDASGRRLYR